MISLKFGMEESNLYTNKALACNDSTASKLLVQALGRNQNLF